MSFIYQNTTSKLYQHRDCLFYDLGSPQTLKDTCCQRNLWNQISAKTQADLPSVDSTESEFPFCYLKPINIFFSQSLAETIK
jgi:hydrogenase small subunit